MIKDSHDGFTKDKSCPTDLAAFYNGVNAPVDKGRTMDDIYPNFCNVFDLVAHNILAATLETHGFDG